MNFSIIAAVDQNLGIGINNKLPWHIKADMDHFAEITIKAAAGKINAVIMGKNTWESLPPKFRPLPERLNVVLYETNDYLVPDGVLLYNSFEQALAELEKRTDLNEIFVIGGASLYTYTIKQPECSKLYLTEIQSTFTVDTYFPQLPPAFKKIEESQIIQENSLQFKYCVYQK